VERQHKFSWIVIIKIFAISLPSQPFLAAISDFTSFFTIGGRTLFLQLGCFWIRFTYTLLASYLHSCYKYITYKNLPFQVHYLFWYINFWKTQLNELTMYNERVIWVNIYCMHNCRIKAMSLWWWSSMWGWYMFKINIGLQ